MDSLSSSAINPTPSCSPHTQDTEVIVKLQNQTLNVEKAQRMAEFFSVLGDTNRLRILSLLAWQELCVCDLARVLTMSESAVSHQLRNLRAMRLVSYKKIGRKVFYTLHDHHILELYQAISEHLDEKD